MRRFGWRKGVVVNVIEIIVIFNVIIVIVIEIIVIEIENIVNIIEIIVAVLGGGFDGGQESSPAVGRDSPGKQQVVSSSQKYKLQCTLIQIHIISTGKNTDTSVTNTYKNTKDSPEKQQVV